jgi:hypothetical protein
MAKVTVSQRTCAAQLTADELYIEAQMAWISDEPNQAKASLKRALELEPEVRELQGSACQQSLVPCLPYLPKS